MIYLYCMLRAFTEGLGVNRGLHTARDAAWIANRWGEVAPGGESEWRGLIDERNDLYGITLQMNARSKVRRV